MRREMRICFYIRPEQKISFVEEYFYDKYGNDILLLKKEEIINEIVNITSKWIYVAEINGIPDGQYAHKMSNYDFIEIRIKKSSLLIRFPYYRDCQNERLVLLLGYDKKDGYKKGSKTEKYVKRKSDEAQKLYDDYHANKNYYKECPKEFANIK
jgi:hypothetical protein